MSFKVSNAQVQGFEPSVDDFKNAFSLTKTGDFRHSVDSTKGVLYVDGSGKLRSANIHGGKGSVTSHVDNESLRLALLNAFRNANASEKFLAAVRDRLFPKSESLLLTQLDEDAHVATGVDPLKRSEVKQLLREFDADRLERLMAPKALEDRDIYVPQASGDKNRLAVHCRELEETSDRIDAFLKRFGGGMDPDDAQALRDFSRLKRDMAEIGRLTLRQQPVDADRAENRMLELRVAFDPAAKRRLSSLLDFCDSIHHDRNAPKTHGTHYGTSVDIGDFFTGADGKEIGKFLKDCRETLQPILDTWDVKDAPKQEPTAQKGPVSLIDVSDLEQSAEDLSFSRYSSKMPGSPIGKYVSEILNNAGDGNCLFYSVLDAQNDALPDKSTKNDRAAGNRMRVELAQHIKTRIDKIKDMGLYRIYHSYGAGYMEAGSVAENLTDPIFAEGGRREQIPTVQVAFLADMLKRPIVLLMDIDHGVNKKDGQASHTRSMICYNRDLETGKVFDNKEPIAIYYSGVPGSYKKGTQGGGHYQAVKLNAQGRKKYNEITTVQPGTNVNNTLV